MRQLSLRPQDVVVVTKLAVNEKRAYTYAQLAAELFMSASEVHSSMKRAELCRLVIREDGMPKCLRTSLREFLICGIQYVFPAVLGAPTRGVPTGVSGPALKRLFASPEVLATVWPSAEGSAHGIAFAPLYPSVPKACLSDMRLYEALSLVDAVRGGAAREREEARKMLVEKLI